MTLTGNLQNDTLFNVHFLIAVLHEMHQFFKLIMVLVHLPLTHNTVTKKLKSYNLMGIIFT